ncbi:MAG: hypothetical protein D6737_02220, partial [Chloroflexi bacterium]
KPSSDKRARARRASCCVSVMILLLSPVKINVIQPQRRKGRKEKIKKCNAEMQRKMLCPNVSAV